MRIHPMSLAPGEVFTLGSLYFQARAGRGTSGRAGHLWAGPSAGFLPPWVEAGGGEVGILAVETPPVLPVARGRQRHAPPDVAAPHPPTPYGVASGTCTLTGTGAVTW